MLYWVRKILPDWAVIKIYLSCAFDYGDILSYEYLETMGWRAVMKDRIHEAVNQWAEEISRRGYQPMSTEEMIAFGGYGHDPVIRRKQ